MATIAEQLSEYAGAFSYDAVPENVKRRARYLILDGAGIALASSTFGFARKTVNSLASFGPGDTNVIGLPTRLPLRDAVLANGVLVHGLDFDDTHLMGPIHATSSCFPAALGVAACANKSGKDLLAAYILGMEVATRVAAVARGRLTQIGFHPTGVSAAFGCALVAGKLYGLSREQLTMAQGVVLSMASGAREYSSNSSGSKRLHPGWAGVAGITAAVLARGGFTGPRTTYEGRFGLYATHLGPDVTPADLARATAELGSRWETLHVAIKPFPVGQLNIVFVDAAIAIARKHHVRPDDIASVEALVPPRAVKVVCEPVAARKRPVDSYAARFSIQYAIACGLMRQKLGLEDLECYQDPGLLALADKVSYRIDPNAGHPEHWSGEVIVTLKNGQVLSHREEDTRGTVDNPLEEDDIAAKFMGNAQVAVSRDRAEIIRDEILALDKKGHARDLAQILSAP
ncbi:MAG: MmgE/PrpD family protein [Betaproteobacteria bacterium]|nr:MmgE/PrpD family protein [Betaproteobacteria bacterium]MBI3938237.1 MmgE/PrpD family protein [Betaproteobacteria bacterium]